VARVDVVANEPATAPELVWLVEAKDYRVITNPPKPANLRDLPETIDKKVRSTLAALAVVAAANSGSAANVHAGKAAAAGRRRVVLHLEPHTPTGTQSALFPTNFSVNVLLKLRQLVRDIDLNPLVLDVARTPGAGVPWEVE